MPKYLEIANDIMVSEHNISYTNIKDRNVANKFRKRMNKKSKYEPRENKNIRYRIIEREYANLGAQISLQNIIKDEDKFILFEAGVDKNFIYFMYSYCVTCYASQGASVMRTVNSK